MDLVTAVKTCFRKYVTFSGRAPRSEYWWWALFALLSNLLIGWIPLLGDLWGLVLLIPGLAVTARRLHDIDRSGWWMAAPYGLGAVAAALIMASGTVIKANGGLVIGSTGMLQLAGLVGVLDFVMVVVLIVWLATRGTDGANRFGTDPLA